MSAAVAAALLAAGLRLAASHEVSLDRPSGPVGLVGKYAEGAPPGFSGGFREESCHACHFHETPNAAPGRLVIEGAPASFAPGERYTLTITLTRTGMKRAGFQLTARAQDSGAQSGSLAPGGQDATRVKVETQGGVQYAGHNIAGSTIGDDGSARWSVEWTAPAATGVVIFNVAANAADGDERVDGDVVYTGAVEVRGR